MSMTRRGFIQSSASLASATLLPLEAGAIASPRESTSNADWRPRQHAQSPNIVLVVLDDVGFGDLGCYGSEIPTKHIDALASGGTRFNNFHVTSLCAPTRAALLTGRNAHAAGVGNLAEWGRDLPGYRGWMRHDVPTIAERLKPHGYKTYAAGKWHLTRPGTKNATGPFDDWPTGRGFDQWYGFLGAASDHWHPELFRNHSAVYPQKTLGYHLTNDLVDQSLIYIKDHLMTAADKPYFLYLALGACHFPYHVPEDYMSMHRGRYDVGWDALRELRIQRQKELGIVPRDTRLSSRHVKVPAWDSLSPEERRFSARTQEAYASFLHHTDDQLGRLVDFFRASGELDNTILMVMSDNGAGSWAPPAGRLDVHRAVYIEPEPIEELIANIDKVGTQESQPSYSPGWAQVSNTPLKLYKGETFEGGIRAPLVVHWPAGNLPNGEILAQYHHVTDIVPTLFELAGQPADGLDGKSFAYTFDHPGAKTQKTHQYYETAGDRAIWKDGWKAVTNHDPGEDFADDQWYLYHSAEDFSEIDDLSEQHPERLSALQSLWAAEAERNQVLPMADDVLSLEHQNAESSPSRFVFYPYSTRIGARSAPDIFNHDYEILIDLDLQDSNANGVLLASGDSMAGYEILMRDGIPEYTYIYTRTRQYRLAGHSSIPSGQHRLVLRGKKTGARSGRVTMLINGEVEGVIELPHMWETKSLNAGVRCGANRGAPISLSYDGDFAFDQNLKRIVIELSS